MTDYVLSESEALEWLEATEQTLKIAKADYREARDYLDGLMAANDISAARARYLERCKSQGIPVVEVSAKVRKELQGWPKPTYLKPRKETIDKLYREWASSKH